MSLVPIALPGWDVQRATTNSLVSFSRCWSDDGLRIDIDDGRRQLLLDFGGPYRFLIDRDCRTVTGPISSDADDATVRHLLLDQILPRLMADEGSLILHAAVVLVSDSATIIVGETGSGKSTLAAALGARAGRLIGDDAAIIENAAGSPYARPTYASLRLNPDSIAALGLDANTGELMAEYSAKRTLPILAHSQVSRAVPISAVVFLTQSDPRPRDLALYRMGFAEACRLLLDQSFALDPTDVGQAKQRLSSVGALVSAAPCYSFTYPHDYRCLDAVCDAVMNLVAAPARA